MSQYSGNNSNGQFNPSYRVGGERTPINVEQLAIEVNGKQITGYQTTYANGISKWTASVHQDQIWDTENVDRSTFTGKKVDGRWIWEPTTNRSVANLANDWIGNGVDYDKVSTNDIARSFFNDPNLKKNFNNTRLEALKAKEGNLSKVKEKFPGMPGTNTATGAEGANNANENFSTGAQMLRDINGSIPDAKDTRKKYGQYCYPADLKDNKQDRIIFKMKTSSGRLIEPSLNANTRSFQRKSTNIEGHVTLPIQSGIKDQNSVDWQGSTMNPLQAFGAATAMSGFEAAFKEGESVGSVVSDALQQGRNAIQQQDAGIRNALNTWIAGQAVGTQNLLSRATGAIANPNMELLFNAPGLRAFDYTFQMSPRQPSEAAEIKSIINFFKQGMSVKTSNTNIFLKSPNIFTIEYLTFDNNGRPMKHPSINRINDCALLVCSVDYTPNNSYMTYSDSTRSMVSYTMNLQFNELDPLYESDYRQDLKMKDSTATSNSIGY